MANGNFGRAAAVTAIFAFVGPVVGATLVIGVMAAALLITDAENGLVALLMWPFAAVLGMLIGFVPALLTGVMMAALSTRLRSRVLWLGVSVLCGVAMTALVYRLASLGSDPTIIIGCGGGSAALCALMTLGWRPRPD